MKRADILRILVPAFIGITLSAVVSQILLRGYRNPSILHQADPPTSTLPRGRMTNLRTGSDEYANVIKGKVLLVFLTIECEACKTEVSNMAQAFPRLSSKVGLYGVFIEPRDDVALFVENNRVNFPTLLDNGGAILARLGFRFMPTKVLLEDGNIKRIWYGSSPNTDALLSDVGEVGAK